MLKLNEYLNVSEAADFLGMDKLTLKIWEKKGKIKSYRHPFNNRLIFNKEELMQILQSIK